MKAILTLLIFATCATAGTLVDSANVFGPDSGKVADALRGKPVWIETAMNTPSGGLKEYADAKINSLTNRGFLVVITTQPRAWRISMAPLGLASSEATRMAGDAMTAKFKRGQFADGAAGLATTLAALVAPSKAADWFWLWVAAGIVAFIGVISAILIFGGRSNRKQLEERTKREAAEFDPDSMTNAQKRKAEKLFNRYTPAERQQMAVQYINTPGYNSSMTDSPWFWWWLMSSNNDPCCHHYSAPAAASVSYERPSYSPPSPTRSDDSPSYSSGYSSSDSSGSSSSYDSGSSSFDSGGSFSDSSGSGGSW